MIAETSSGAILPGGRIGVLGGGQLGRMFVFAAAELGYHVTVLDPDPDAPACQVAHEVIVAPYDDLDAVRRLARAVDVVTAEFENVPARSLEAAESETLVRPSSKVFRIAQDRGLEKAAMRELGIPVAPYALVELPEDLARAAESVGFPAILKTATAGYDGRGQSRVHDLQELSAAWQESGQPRAVLERQVDFLCEVSVVGVRGPDGLTTTYEPVRNDHANHVLDVSVCPAPLPPHVADEARRLAREVLLGLDVVGVMCIEFFVDREERLMVNEVAPRPHNSGHLTLEAHVCNQFEQQARAVCGLPAGSTERLVQGAAMANLMGELWSAGEPDWLASLNDPKVRLHLYGKQEARPGRKMGHLTTVAEDVDTAERRIRAARESLTRGRTRAEAPTPAPTATQS